MHENVSTFALEKAKALLKDSATAMKELKEESKDRRTSPLRWAMALQGHKLRRLQATQKLEA